MTACIDWVLNGNDFGECRRTQCPKVLPCTMEGCGKPAPDKWCLETLSLYQDCKQRNALPGEGGVLDQRADLMRWFRVLDERVAEFKKEQADRERLEWQMSKRT